MKITLHAYRLPSPAGDDYALVIVRTTVHTAGEQSRLLGEERITVPAASADAICELIN